ncbi:pilus assembly protein PilM [Candidatus Azambacteria bacterium]|nr:pilus assembly protein PilM [Candidatus Azambacteria bacterium]
MDLAQLFKPVEKIVGMEIAHGRVCAVLLEKDKKGVVTGTKKEAVIPHDIVAEDGTVLDKQKLALALKTIWHAGKDVLRSKYVIVALPSAPVFTDIVRFPKVTQEQLKEAMELHMATKTSFPIDTNDIYYDWQPLTAHNVYHEDVLLSFAKQPYIRDFAEACEAAGLEPLAFETPQPATLRAITNFEKKTGLLIRVSQECAEFSIAAGADLFFTRTIPLPPSYDLETLKNALATEATHALNYYATENPEEAPVTTAVLLTHVPQKQELAAHLRTALGIEIADARFAHDTAIGDSCAAAFGAALRGLVRREEDTLISLLPIGTEEAYRKRRFLAYVSLWSDIINATALLLVVLFGATWFFVNIAYTNAVRQTTQLKAASGASTKSDELEQNAQRFNAAVGRITAANDTIMPWSLFIEKTLPSFTKNDITMESVSFPSFRSDGSLQITAKTRASAIAFRKALEEDPLFSEVHMPFLSVTQKENILLTITFRFAPQP